MGWGLLSLLDSLGIEARYVEVGSQLNYTDMFWFEKNYDEKSFQLWMDKNWTLCFFVSAIYLFLIKAGQKYMQNRPAFNLRIPLIVWSGCLAVFSIAGAVRTIPDQVRMLFNYGVTHSICVPTYYYGPTAFWCMLFALSKVVELGDTAFIVLRKQPLIFLHYYHHVTVLLYMWYAYPDHTAPGLCFMVMNYTVHAFMYTYYTFKALRFRIPRWIAMIVTTLQLSQMFFGLGINLTSYAVKNQGYYCQQSYDNIRYSFLMYFSYFVLFGYFFYTAYVKKKPIAGIAVTRPRHTEETCAKKEANSLLVASKKTQ